MKRILIYIAVLVALSSVASCSMDQDDKDVAEIEQWTADNTAWYEAMAAQTEPFAFERIVPAWNKGAEVLMHWYNDRSLTAGNLVPLETSTVDVKYRLTIYGGTPVDSSYLQPDSTFRTRVTGVISGFQIALQQMHVGDSVCLVIRASEGYGASATGKIPAYSTLKFDLKLKDIYRYELP